MSTAPSHGERRGPLSPGNTLRLALVAGLAGGLAEVLSIGLQRYAFGKPVYLSRDFFWMIPIANLALFALLAAGLILAGRLVPRVRSLPLVAGVTGGLAAGGVFLAWPELHRIAVVLMAAGVGVQFGRRAGRAAPAESGLMFRRPLALLAIAAVVTGVAGAIAVRRGDWAMARAKPAATPGAPNVLLLVWDTVRDQNLSTYGYQRPTAPFLDRFAATGVRFSHAIASAPWTLPSHASFFTGRWPHEHQADWEVPLSTRYPVLAEAFDSAGYRTGGFVGNTFYCTRESGLSRGFEHYVDFRITPAEILYSAAFGRAILNQSWLRPLIGEYRPASFNSAEALNAEFLGWAGSRGERPFFGFINYFDAHVPRLVPAPPRFGDSALRPLHLVKYALNHADMRGWLNFPPALMQTEIDAYDSGIAYIDQATAALLDTLRQRGLLDNTIVVITSDHGELFGEHGVAGHGTSLYRGALEVPLIVVAPGRVPAGIVVDSAVSLLDLPATLLDLAGQRDPFRFPGRSLLRFLAPGGATSDTVLAELGPQGDRQIVRFPKIGTGMRTVFADGHQYILNGDGTEELYAFPSDSDQVTDLAAGQEGGMLLPRYRAMLAAMVR